MEPSGTELDEYEQVLMLPQIIEMVHLSDKNTILYRIEKKYEIVCNSLQ